MIEAPVTRATLLEDRAFVTREGTVQLEAGVSQLQVVGVSPALVDKSLTAELPGGRVLHVRVERYQSEVPPPPQEDPEEAEARERRRKGLEADLHILDRELESARRLFLQLLQEMTLEVSWGRLDRASWEKQMGELQAWKLQLVSQRADLEQQLEEISRWTPLVVPSAKGLGVRADLFVDVEMAQAGTALLKVEYAVPGACWRPYHTAVLAGDKLEFRCDGCVWQNTGEDWQDVELLFSTQRPSLGAEPPPLPQDVLTARKKSTETVVAQRDVEVQDLVEDSEPSPRRGRAPEVPGIDDGGDALHMRGLARARIPSNGQPVRVELFSFTAEASLERLLTAEICAEVILKSTQKNGASMPILAGPVDLIREAGLVGRSSLHYVAAGETFALGWGPDPFLRAARVVARGEEEKDDLLGGWFKAQTVVTVTLSNLGLEEREVRVVERVPVSELKEVEIGTEATLDAHGFTSWTVPLGARGRKEIKLTYSVRRGKKVVGL